MNIKNGLVAGVLGLITLPLFCTAQIVRLDSAATLGWQASTVLSSPFEANAAFTNTLDSGPVTISTAGYFTGQSHTNRNLVDCGGASLALDFTPTSLPSFSGWDWIYRYYAIGYPDYIRGPEVLSDYFKAGVGISFLFSQPVAGFSIDVSFGTAPGWNAAPGAYQVLAFGDDGALLGSIASTHTWSNYLDKSTWENLSFETAGFSESIKGVTVIQKDVFGVFIDSQTIRVADTADLAAVPEPSAFIPAGMAALGLLIYSRIRQRRTNGGTV